MIWLVRNPGPLSVLQDIVIPLSPDEFAAYATGTGLVRFRHERHTMHTTEEGAMQDAHDRLARRG